MGSTPARHEWALVVATYSRPQMLRACVEHALAQDPLPSEVVVVDASADWEQSAEQLRPLVEQLGLRYVHEPAQEKSLTVQRNQGIAMATADVLFLIDDDSLMHPGCAAALLQVYDADVDLEVAGVQASLDARLPVSASLDEGDRKATGFDAGRLQQKLAQDGLAGRLLRFVWRRVFLMDHQALFVPYDGAFPAREVPRALQHLDVATTPLFHGCRMTYRRSVVLSEPFEDLLRSYCPGEDLDASYRASRHGVLLTAAAARVHHFEAATGRIDRQRTTTLSTLNQAVLLRRHAGDVDARWRDFARLNRRRLVAEGLKDLLSRRWQLPQVRGLVAALRTLPAIRKMSDAELAAAYPVMQVELLSA